jgi:hypothetical protein
MQMGASRFGFLVVLAISGVALLSSLPGRVFAGSDCNVEATDFIPIEAMLDGRLAARECALRKLSRFTNYGLDDPTTSASYVAARRSGQLLQRYYIRRAQLQQTFLDIGSLGTIVGGAGALSGNQSTSSRTSWAIGAFVPSIISQFNGFQPKRELYHGGALAVQIITARYDRLFRSHIFLQQISQIDCREAQLLKSEIEGALRSDSALPEYDKERMLRQEINRLHDVCASLKTHAESINFIKGYAHEIRAVMIADYANDLLTLDQALLAKDRSLRYTPVGTLSAIIASPLRAADLAITGQDTKAALDTVRMQEVFSGLNRSLAQTPLPPLPSEMPVGVVAPASAALLTLAAPLPSNAPNTPENRRRRAEIDHATRVTALATRLAFEQKQVAFHHALMTEMLTAARSDILTFQYDSTTQTTTVSVTQRTLAPTITASTSPATN